MIEPYPWIMADNWKYFIKKGVRVFGLLPHCVDQNRTIPSEIMDADRRFHFKKHFVRMFFRRAWHMLFNLFGHYEKASYSSSLFIDQYT